MHRRRLNAHLDLAILDKRVIPSALPVGAELHVNEQTSSESFNSDVAANSSGDHVVVWQSGDYLNNSPDGSGTAILGRLYNCTGTPLTPEFIVNQFAPGVQWVHDMVCNHAAHR